MTKDTYVETNHAAKETRHVLGGQTVSAAEYNNGIRPNDQEADDAPAEDETTPANNWSATRNANNVARALIVQAIREARETILAIDTRHQHRLLATLDHVRAYVERSR